MNTSIVEFSESIFWVFFENGKKVDWLVGWFGLIGGKKERKRQRDGLGLWALRGE